MRRVASRSVHQRRDLNPSRGESMPSRASSPSKKQAILRRTSKRKSPRSPRRTKYSARTADPHELYQLSVQSPENDIEFLVETFKKLRKRTPYRFREDFCGTALLSATWIQRG